MELLSRRVTGDPALLSKGEQPSVNVKVLLDSVFVVTSISQMVVRVQ